MSPAWGHSPPFSTYPADCDMLGHLNHATMLNFLERARWALLEPQIDVR